MSGRQYFSVGAMMAGASVNEISLDDDDDDAALEAMIAKELGTH